MKVPFLDLRVSIQEDREELLNAIDAVLQHGRLINGPEVQELEAILANYCGRRYGIGVNSGTDALFLGMKSLGIGPGDEVITTSLSWIATANAIALTGATPVFADIKEDLNLDTNTVEKLITSKTKAILPVHYTGRICDMDELVILAQKYNIHIIEDGAQAFGASYKGKKAGSFGIIACFSANPMKVFSACGEAGFVVTDDPELYEKLQILRYNGTINKEECIQTSLNGRLDTLQAAILLKRVGKLRDVIKRRKEIAYLYSRELSSIVKTPNESSDRNDIYYTYTIRVTHRDKLKQYLESKGIEVKIQHPFLMSQQPIYRSLRTHNVPQAEKLVQEILCLPVHEKLTHEQILYVVKQIKEFYAQNE